MRPPHKQTTQGVVIKNNILDYQTARKTPSFPALRARSDAYSCRGRGGCQDEEMSKQMLFCFLSDGA